MDSFELISAETCMSAGKLTGDCWSEMASPTRVGVGWSSAGQQRWLGHVSEKAMATHSSSLAWQIPWTEEPGRLLSLGSHRVGHDWSNLAVAVKFQMLLGSSEVKSMKRLWRETVSTFLPGFFSDHIVGSVRALADGRGFFCWRQWILIHRFPELTVCSSHYYPLKHRKESMRHFHILSGHFNVRFGRVSQMQEIFLNWNHFLLDF